MSQIGEDEEEISIHPIELPEYPAAPIPITAPGVPVPVPA